LKDNWKNWKMTKLSFVENLFRQNYSHVWEPEPEYRAYGNREFANAVAELRNRTGLTQSQFASSSPGGCLETLNIRTLETKGTPMHPGTCAVLAYMASGYGLPRLAAYFRSCVLQITHSRKPGRRFNLNYEEEMPWLHEKL
jgi:hypothetical protein